ncbi:hypothetical protein HDU67_002324 [Dinochytrium kinnereticum]|nr:hypothetical protein HDU67_002324 [Dinochytrium kinnereticum]
MHPTHLETLLQASFSNTIRSLPDPSPPGGDRPEDPGYPLTSLLRPDPFPDFTACIHSIVKGNPTPPPTPSPVNHDAYTVSLFLEFLESFREAWGCGCRVRPVVGTVLGGVVDAVCTVFQGFEKGEGEEIVGVVPPSPEGIKGTGTEVGGLEARPLLTKTPSTPTPLWSFTDPIKVQETLQTFIAGPPTPTFPHSHLLTREKIYLLLTHRVTLGTAWQPYLPPTTLDCFHASIRVHARDLEAEMRRREKMVAKGKEWEAKVLLTVGARALAKHAGYGARFYIHKSAPAMDGETKEVSTKTGSLEFRGFLEPPMENGHEVGWRH